MPACFRLPCHGSCLVGVGAPRAADLIDDMVLADRRHGTGLRTLNALAFRDHEPDFVCDLKFVEVRIDHAVFVEVDLLAVRHFHKAVILEELSNLAMFRGRVGFYAATYPPCMVFQLTSRRVESITDGNVDIFMRMIERP
jgi:hypothetical protein